jgi:hypothetical protein
MFNTLIIRVCDFFFGFKICDEVKVLPKKFTKHIVIPKRYWNKNGIVVSKSLEVKGEILYHVKMKHRVSLLHVFKENLKRIS